MFKWLEEPLALLLLQRYKHSVYQGLHTLDNEKLSDKIDTNVCAMLDVGHSKKEEEEKNGETGSIAIADNAFSSIT